MTAPAVANCASGPRHWSTSTAGTTSANGSPSARARAGATYDWPRPRASASRARRGRARMPTSRAAGGPWWGASHAGHGASPSSASGARSSNARAPSAATAGAGPTAPGVSKQASGSGSGARCSERIRGGCVQRTAVRGLELVHVGNRVVVGGIRAALLRERAPRRRVRGRQRELPHDARVEAPEAATGGIGGEPRERGEPARVEERRQRVRVVCGTGRDAVDRVQGNYASVGYDGSESPGEVRPDHPVWGVGQRETKQLPGRTPAVVAAAAGGGGGGRGGWGRGAGGGAPALGAVRRAPPRQGRHRIDRGPPPERTRLGHWSHPFEARACGEPPPQRLCVPARRELRGDEER